MDDILVQFFLHLMGILFWLLVPGGILLGILHILSRFFRK